MFKLICIFVLFTNWVENASFSTLNGRISEDRYLDRTRRGAQEDAAENAILEKENNCTCVRYYLCNSDNQINKNGVGLLDLRIGIPPEKCKGGQFFGDIVCCKHASVNDNTDKGQTENKNNQDGTHEGRTTDENTNINKNDNKNENHTHGNNNDEKDRNGNQNEGKTPETTDTSKPVRKLRCGIQKPSIDVRILGDEVTPLKGEFPWMAAIFKNVNNEFKFTCSGTLIHPRVILTANHYVHKKRPEQFKVLVNGDIALTSRSIESADVRKVTEIVHHPAYYAGALFNDAAMLILSEPYAIERNSSINTLCLSPETVNLGSSRCWVAGWGQDSGYPKKLKKIDLPVVDNAKCQNLLRKTRLGETYDLHESFMCAGGEKDKDACMGDGGSPLMCPDPDEEGQFFQMGIVSWGVGCGEANVPGIYASVPYLKEWIAKELDKRDIKFE